MIIRLLLALLLNVAIASNSFGETAPKKILFVFDLSHSMTKSIERGQPTKIQIARESFNSLFAKYKSTSDLALLSFGDGNSANKEQDCQAATLLQAFTSNNPQAVADTLAKTKPVGHQTPIAYALEKAKELIQQQSSAARIVLISDGEETCDSNPEEIAQSLAELGAVVDTIGIGEAGAFAQLGAIALAGGGTFQLASNTSELLKALGQSTGTPQNLEFPDSGPENLSADFNAPAGNRIRIKPAPLVTEIEIPQKKINKLEGPVMSLEIILDASGSMAAKIDGKQKIILAKEVLNQTVSKIDETLVRIAFRAYGFDNSIPKTPEASCPNTELLVGFDKGSVENILSSSQNLSVYGYTPIALSLKLAGEDLKPYPKSERSVILISDGKETCGGDPVAELKALEAQGIKVKVNVIGFDIDEEARQQLKSIADASGGKYYDANDSKALLESMQLVINSILSDAEELVPDRIVRPIAGGDSLENAVTIKPGTYTLDKHLEKGEKAYFFLPSKRAQRAIFVGYSQAPKIIENESGFQEAAYASASFAISVYAPKQESRRKNKATRRVKVDGELGSSSLTHYVDTTGDGVFFAIGSDLNRLNKDTLFKIELQEVGDLFEGEEADESHQGDILLPLDLSVPNTAHLGLEDRADTYLIEDLKGLEKLVVDIEFSDEVRSRRVAIKPKLEPFVFRVEFFDAETGKRIKRFTREETKAKLELLLEGREAVILKIKDQNAVLYNMFSPYQLEVRPNA